MSTRESDFRHEREFMKKAKQLLIDLTPLLDVILIILFLVLVNSNEQSKRAMADQQGKFDQREEALAEQIAEQDSEIEQLRDERERLLLDLSRAERLGNLSDTEAKAADILLGEATIIVVEIPANYPDAKLELTVNDQETIVKPDDQSIDEFLNGKITSNKSKINLLMLQYPGNQILWRDYSIIKQNIERILSGQDDILFAEENIR